MRYWLQLVTCRAAIKWRGGLFSVVYVCGFVCLFVNTITLEPLRYHREIFTGARYGKKLERVPKWLNSDALRLRFSTPW